MIKYIGYEFEKEDVDATMTTMTDSPYIPHVPTLTGDLGYDRVYHFYKNNFVGKMPKDIKIKPLSRTVDKDQVVDEIIISFTRDREMIICCLAWHLPVNIWRYLMWSL